MRLPWKITGVLLAVGMAVGFTVAAVPANADTPSLIFFATETRSPTGAYVPTGQCLEAVPGPDFVYRVATERCRVSTNQAQQWVPVNQGGGVYKFVNHAVNWCLYTDTRFNGSPIALWDCSVNISNTRWAWDPNASFQHVESRISGTTGHCLDVPGGQVLPGLWMQLFDCNQSPAQTFITTDPNSGLLSAPSVPCSPVMSMGRTSRRPEPRATPETDGTLFYTESRLCSGMQAAPTRGSASRGSVERVVEQVT